MPPVVGLVKFTAAVDWPAHSVWLGCWFTIGVGFTVMVNVIGVPVQVTPALVNCGVTVIVATSGALVALVALNAAMSPVPAGASPIAVLLLVQL